MIIFLSQGTLLLFAHLPLKLKVSQLAVFIGSQLRSVALAEMKRTAKAQVGPLH